MDDALESRFEARISRDRLWFRQAQLLRHRAFMAAPEEVALPLCGVDDRFDAHCEHLVVRDLVEDVTVGACRILAPDGARRAGGYESERLFDLELLGVLRDRMVEVGRTCVHPEYRTELVMHRMLSALARYLIETGHDHVIGAADLDIGDGGHRAAAIHRDAWERSASPEDYRVFPLKPFPVDSLAGVRDSPAPPVLRSYLDEGAWVSGEPALDNAADSALIPFLMPLARMRDRYARQFLAQAA
jgi:putative hemolysin